MGRRLISAVVAVSLLVIFPACGEKTDEATRAAGITPINALAFVTVNLEPSLEQKRNLLSVARRFPVASEKVKGEFDQTRDDLLDDLVKEAGLDFKRDVEPWLGDEVALAMLPTADGGEPRAVVFVQTTDGSKATTTLDKVRKSGDFDGAFRTIEGFVVISDQGGAISEDEKVLDVIAAQAEKEDGGLAKSKAFVELVDELAGDRLVLAWTDVRAIVSLAQETTAIPGFDLTKAFKDASSVALDFHAEKEALVFAGVARPFNEGKGGDPKITEGLAKDSIGAFTFFDVATVFNQVMELVSGGGSEGAEFAEEFERQTGLNLQTDILSWMEGEFVMVAGAVPEGQTFPDFGLVIEPTDMDKAKAALPKIVQSLQNNGNVQLEERPVDGGTTAYVVPEPFSPGIQPAMALFKDRFVLANRAEYLEELSKPAPSKLEDSSSYRKVVGDGSSQTVAQMVLRIDPIREAVENAFLGSAEGDELRDYETEIKPNLVPLDSFGLHARHDGKFDRFEMKLTFD